jgi:hypothetical protein
VKEEWHGLDKDIIKLMYASMPHRLDELLENKGENTSY